MNLFLTIVFLFVWASTLATQPDTQILWWGSVIFLAGTYFSIQDIRKAFSL